MGNIWDGIGDSPILVSSTKGGTTPTVQQVMQAQNDQYMSAHNVGQVQQSLQTKYAAASASPTQVQASTNDKTLLQNLLSFNGSQTPSSGFVTASQGGLTSYMGTTPPDTGPIETLLAKLIGLIKG